jgi:tRNA dimethylallyltransferase
MPGKQIFVVQGPTASGKTSLAIALAQYYQTEIISFDSRQFYKELAIGVARPMLAELQQVKHHFIASHSVQAPLNAAQFAAQARPVLDRLLQEKGAVVLVGGSSLFADALLLGLDPLPHNAEVQAKWQEIFEQEGVEALQKALQRQDPDFYQEVDVMNPLRLIRALEINELTGKSNLELRKGIKPDPDNLQRFYLDWPRQELYERINWRVDQMVGEGLEEEVLAFFPQDQTQQALQTVGYQEFFNFFNGLCHKDIAIEKIKQHSRNYAKRQLTWLSRYSQIHALDPKSELSLLKQALQLIG